MKRWELWHEIIKETKFYRRKLIFFLLIVVVGLSIFYFWQKYSQASYETDVFSAPKDYSNSSQLDIEVKDNAVVYINGVKNTKVITFHDDYDELRILVFDSPGHFISNFEAIVHLPTGVDQSQIRQIIYAVHGVGSTRAYMEDSKTLVYEARDISSHSTLTIVAYLPKGMVVPSFYQKIKFEIERLPVKTWLYLAIILPCLAIFLLAFMVFKRHSDQLFHPKGILDKPPAPVHPAIVGVLVDGTVGSREIAATIIDLAKKGYIYIINKGSGNFSFGIKKAVNFENLTGLLPYEKALLSKIFLPSSFRSSVGEIDMRIGRHIFSRKIAQFYLEVYNEATREGYFIKNPAKVHLTYKYAGIGLFFLSFFSFILNAIVGADPNFSLIFWVGGMLASVIIIRLSPFMPARSNKGRAELQKWLAFRRFLTDRKPLVGQEVLQNKFEEFLPYAIVLGAEVEWARRFGREPFYKPGWYESSEPAVTLESFSGQFFPIIGYIAKNLAQSHEPTVE